MPASKVAISLPEQLLRLIDAECRSRGVTRSEFIRRAVSRVFERIDEERADRAYVESYLKDPEDPGVAEAYLKIASEVFEENPWE